MDQTIDAYLKYLELPNLRQRWNAYLKDAAEKKCSYQHLLTTIITSQLGFDEWGSFVNDRHLTAAILDRITENCTVFNMSKCISIRKKRIEYAADKGKSE